MARPCTTCTRKDAAIINAEILSGQSVAAVSAKYGISDSTLRRHVGQHLSSTLLRELRVNEEVGVVDLLDLLVEALSDVSTVRSAAIMSGRSDLVLKAADRTRVLVNDLLGVLGVDEQELLRELKTADALARSVAVVVKQVPALASLIADELRSRGEDETAHALEQVGRTATAALAERQDAA